MPAPEQSRSPTRLVACAALLLLAGCANADKAAYAAYAAAAATPAATEPLAAVRALIGDAACSTDAQCRTVAVGAKACGGPEAYLAWSTQRSDAQKLEAAAASYNSSRLEMVARSGRMSNCALTVDPGAWCAPAGTGRACQLRPVGSGPVR
jgi:hypothetical protein